MTELSRRKRIVVLGGYGVFGGKLAEALLRHEHLEVIVAGRSQRKAEAFCRRHGGTAAFLDRTAPDFAAALLALRPFVTVDAAGPFQAYRQAPTLLRKPRLQPAAIIWIFPTMPGLPAVLPRSTSRHACAD